MKRIEFIAPVEAIRGNLSGKRKLTYAPDNNPAWGVTSSERQYANNYVPRFIGAKRSKDGKTYFAVKTKSAVKMSAAMRLQIAVLTVSSVAANCIMNDLSTLTSLQNMYVHSYEYQSLGWSFKRWIMASVRTGLKEKNDIFFNAAGYASIIFQNPYKKSHVNTAIALPDFPSELLVKFWTQLADNPITFTIAGQTGIAHSGDTWANLDQAPYNVLGVATDGDVYLNNMQVTTDDTAVSDFDTIINGEAYLLVPAS